MASHRCCCNPFDIPGHSWNSRKKSLRSVSEWMCNKADITMGSNICDTCRKKLAKYPDLHTVTESPEQGDSDASTGEKYQLDAPEVVSSVNRCLLEIGETLYHQLLGA